MIRYIATFLACLLFVSAAATPAERADSLYARAARKYRSGAPADAMDSLFLMIKIAGNPSAGVSPESLSGAYLMLGNIYLAYGDNINAAKYYGEGLALTADTLQRVKFNYNLSLTYCHMGQEGKARHFHRRLLELDAPEQPLWLYDKVAIEALIEKTFGSHTRSVELFRRAVFLADSLGLPAVTYAAAPISEIVEYYNGVNELDSLYYWLSRYEKVASGSHPHIVADCQRSFLKYYIKRGEREMALDYIDRYLLSMDSLVNYRRFLRVSSKQELERAAAADAQIRSLEFTVSKQKFMMFAILVALVCAALVWAVVKKMRRNTRQLFARNRELAILEEEITRGSGGGADRGPADETAATGGAAGASDGSRSSQWDDLMRRVNLQVSDPRNFCDPDFSINTLASLCDSNSRYVSQAINETTGDNFRALVNGHRIREARRRLTSDPGFADLTIQSVGESVGFRSASNFINAFKKVTGMTPSLYQRMSRAGERQ